MNRLTARISLCRTRPQADVIVNHVKIDAAVYELAPLVVTKDNAMEAFANDPGRLALFKSEFFGQENSDSYLGFHKSQ